MNTPTTTVLDLVIPVHNEERVVAASVRTVHRMLTETFPYPFRITVADSGSTDGTAMVARRLVRELPCVHLHLVAQKGRGLALKRAWSASDAMILAYLDVDLSTDLDALAPLVAPLMSGHSDVAIGSRRAHGSHVVRGLKREVISRGYNFIVHSALRARFSDAQCGFKAIRADVAGCLLPLIVDDSWFFDTELLVLAERAGLRIHEVPVDWYDDPDSRVQIARTACDDLRGVWRLRRTRRAAAYELAGVRNRLGRNGILAAPAFPQSGSGGSSAPSRASRSAQSRS
ncbi:dolichyl-phosphate beta-glucosyltransferase [Flexivirga aerilata]|uniref:dolichyl-phosphate beta-glucosyltransferase n=1 Tax=Flexivirga aerilata TaxID=1656889 RepID=UPI0031B5673F